MAAVLRARFAHAQCASGNLDALDAARRGRSTLYDFQRLNAGYVDDRDTVYRALDRYKISRLTEPLPPPPGPSDPPAPPTFIMSPDIHLFTNAAIGGGLDYIGGYRLCTVGGIEKAATLLNYYGVVAGVDERHSHLAAELTYLHSQARLSVLPDPAAPMATAPDRSIGIGQDLIAWTGRYHDAIQVMAGWMLPETNTSHDVVYPAERLSTASQRAVFSLGSPGAHLSQTAIFGSDRPIETLYVDLHEFPIPSTKADVSALVAYVSDEKETFSGIGAGYRYGILRFAGDTAVEYNGVRLRHARGKVEFGGGNYVSGLYAGFSLYLAGSVFNGRYLLEQTGKSAVPGIDFGMKVLMAFPYLSFGAEIEAGANRPEILTLFAGSVNSPQLSARGFLRISPWVQ
jgi:hypothetical protein